MFAGALLRGKLQEKVYPLLTTTSSKIIKYSCFIVDNL